MGKKITKETYIKWYELMELIREFEMKSGMLFGQQKIRGFCHLYIGQEAVVAGTMSALEKDDKWITAYRDHGHALAVGMSPDSIMAELMGKIDGCSKGKGGSMHLFSKEHNFFGGHGIVGAGIPMGAGIAFAEKYRGTKNICVNFFGDGASVQGSLHETFNMAMTWKIPCIFVVENNKYGMGTAIERVTNVTELYKKACAYEMPAAQVDGMDVVAVHNAMEKAAKIARDESLPYFLEVLTYRYKGHSMSDPAKYRTKEELENYQGRDPIVNIKKAIVDKKYMTAKELESLRNKIKDRVKKSIEFAEKSPMPDPEEIYKDVYVQKDYPFLMD